jgi:quercetin dioxygenase-like cupin family protein
LFGCAYDIGSPFGQSIEAAFSGKRPLSFTPILGYLERRITREGLMNGSFARVLIVSSVAALGPSGIFGEVAAARAADVPDALSVEWQGKKPCEKLFDDEQVRVARCTFPPGAVHVCHSHPSYLSYVVSGGQRQVEDEKGIRKINVTAGAIVDVPPTPWHEFANKGDTTIQFVIVEKKYQAVTPASQTACPKGTAGRSQ